ncbi:MAG: L-aspartate oxidase [Actinomycetota bacterium]
MAETVRLDAPLVVGAGVAGLTVALQLPRSYVLASPQPGSTGWAQGGIAVAIGSDDSPGRHAADTAGVAGGLAVDEMVEILTREGPGAVLDLIRQGARFDRDPGGELLLSREGGHSRRRVVHTDGDATGAEVMRALSSAVDSSGTVNMIRARAVDLVMVGDRVAGVIAADGRRHQVLLAPAVVLATGGAGRIFSHTTNPEGVTGDGIAMAARIGARLADLEFVQFHPTALQASTDPMPLVTEALRGEGATLVDACGRRFMDAHHPMAELAPRDVVARAIFQRQDRGLDTFLDTGGVPHVAERFPTVTASARSAGLDPARDLLPVSPAAHYYMGGIDTDGRGRTSVCGLWAVGECASTGVHGANRLASNSLLEGLVFGSRTAQDVAGSIREPRGEPRAPKEGLDLALAPGPGIAEARRVMWELVGLVRTGPGLEEAGRRIRHLDGELRRSVGGRVMADLAPLVIEAAFARSESRGGHYRADHPQADPHQAHRRRLDPAPVDLVALA